MPYRTPRENARGAHPEDEPGDRCTRITPAHLDRLDTAGYVLVPGFLKPQELADCQREIRRYFPPSSVLLAAGEPDTGGGRVARFPFTGDTLNHVTTHPQIIDFLERVYRTRALCLGESAIQVKYGRRIARGADQLLHNDAWGKKSLLYPRDDGIFRHTFMIFYYSDVTTDLAPTRMVSRENTRDMDLLTPAGETSWSRDDQPELYAREKPVLATAGSLLIYTAKTLHRGTAVTAETGERYAHFLSYHAAAATWLQSHSWPSGTRPYPDSAAMRRFVERAAPRQRELLGFPHPGHAYWCSETLRGVAARYPGMDMTPYSAPRPKEAAPDDR